MQYISVKTAKNKLDLICFYIIEFQSILSLCLKIYKLFAINNKEAMHQSTNWTQFILIERNKFASPLYALWKAFIMRCSSASWRSRSWSIQFWLGWVLPVMYLCVWVCLCVCSCLHAAFLNVCLVIVWLLARLVCAHYSGGFK